MNVVMYVVCHGMLCFVFALRIHSSIFVQGCGMIRYDKTGSLPLSLFVFVNVHHWTWWRHLPRVARTIAISTGAAVVGGGHLLRLDTQCSACRCADCSCCTSAAAVVVVELRTC